MTAEPAHGLVSRLRSLFQRRDQTAALMAGQAVSPLIPPRTVARRALLSLIAIMCFLACLAVAGVSIVNDRAAGWQRQITEEVTIQVRPIDGADTQARIQRALEITRRAPGIAEAVALSADQAADLLRPWLGAEFDESVLPVPRLIAVRVGSGADLPALAARLKEEVPGVTLDDHGIWLGRLAAMANVMIAIGIAVFALVLIATGLSVIFATRGAMATNRDVIEVLHFIGAGDAYIAGEFQKHFLYLGATGTALGGGFAILLFAFTRLFLGFQGVSPEATQLRGIFGGLMVGPAGYAGSIFVIATITLAVALTARITVRNTLAELD